MMDILAAVIGTIGGTAIGIWLGFRWLNKNTLRLHAYKCHYCDGYHVGHSK